MTSTARSPPSKRSHEDADGADATETNTKRTRRSRWGSDDDDGVPAKQTTPPSAKVKLSALSDIVKRLSSVVKEKSAIAAIPTASSPEDAAAARARALAQASLLAMGLSVGQTSPTDLAKRVYVGNLYYDLREDDVRSFFGPFGTIRAVDLSMEPGMTRSKGYCFIEYEDVLAAESAVQVLNGAHLSNRSLKVGRPHRGNSSDPSSAQNIGKEAIKNVQTKCVYVAGVRVELNSHHLQSIFSPFGDIRACVMTAISPLETAAHRGYGFLEFADETSASNAIQHMNGFELAGQKLKVGKASPSAMLINLTLSQDKVVIPKSGESAVLPTVEKDPAVADDVADEGRCLCLLNMVDKGDVDDDLAEEVRDECSRFGAVERVAVEELEDHVRVFVVFLASDGAQQAKRAMHGRFFGGKQVRAVFYPLEQLRLKRYESGFLP